MMTPRVPAIRVRPVNEAPLRPERPLVVYWMTAARRRGHNFALARAAALAEELGRALLVLEALRVDYPWASDRLHGFVLDGMADNQRAFSDGRAGYYPYVEPAPRAGAELLAALGAHAAVVVTDYFPSFFLPRMLPAAGKKLDVRLEAVDGNGLLPIAAAQTDFPTAYAFRRFLQGTLPPHLEATQRPAADPLAGHQLEAGAMPEALRRRWPAASEALLQRSPRALAALPVDHSVAVAALRGGSAAARATLDRFIAGPLSRYGLDRNHPDDGAASGLSPYLHFGHVSAHEVFARIVDEEAWTPAQLGRLANGKREAWWGLSAPAESFLDELVTWRELGYNHCARNPRSFDQYETLPAWARRTLEAHAEDPRPFSYSLEELAESRTHDEVWNAAQTELRTEGRMHSYLRMLWGKKILEWSPSPRAALVRLIELNNRYALDGRDPNSYTGILWTLGRYDRPWAPERPIFGQIRYMSSANTRRKLHLRKYLARYCS